VARGEPVGVNESAVVGKKFLPVGRLSGFSVMPFETATKRPSNHKHHPANAGGLYLALAPVLANLQESFNSSRFMTTKTDSSRF